jgi:hypothetical protein
MTIQSDSPKALGYQQILPTVSTGLTIPAGTRYAIVTCLGAAVRWRDDRAAPTPTVGYPLSPGSELLYDSGSLPGLRFIEQTAGAELNVCYYG